jgi:hypothetical protein
LDKDAKHGRELLPLFKAADQWIRDFRTRHRFSLRGPALKRRCLVSNVKQEEFILHVQSTLRTRRSRRLWRVGFGLLSH